MQLHDYAYYTQFPLDLQGSNVSGGVVAMYPGIADSFGLCIQVASPPAIVAPVSCAQS